MRHLNDFEADSFALMILAGATVTDACAYFIEGPSPEHREPFIQEAAETWPEQPEVLDAIKRHMGGAEWHKLTDSERVELAMRKHYNEMAYFLYTHNYAELGGNDKLKADTCRQALEAKLAGMAGKQDPLRQFYLDMMPKLQAEQAEETLQ